MNLRFLTFGNLGSLINEFIVFAVTDHNFQVK